MKRNLLKAMVTIGWLLASTSGCGDGSGSALRDYLAAEMNGVNPCPLGWTNHSRAHGDLGNQEIVVRGSCNAEGRANAFVGFAPMPSPGGSAPCTHFFAEPNGSPVRALCPNDNQTTPRPTGSVDLTGSAGNLRVRGSCSCVGDEARGSVQFDLPFTPQ
jgi:hypothetical protein